MADPAKAQAQGAPQIHEVAPNNTIYQWHLGDQKAADAAFEAAKHVTKLDIVNNRLVPNAMEPRVAHRRIRCRHRQLHALEHDAEPACRAARDRGLRRHGARAQAARDRAGCRRRLRLEDLHLSRRSRLPVGVEEGRPSGEVDVRSLRSLPDRRAWPRSRHPRRNGVRRRRQDHRRCGSRPSPISAPTCRPSRRRCRPISTRTLLSGQYDIPAIYCEVDAVYTNTVPVDAYRGAGRPEATFVVERLVEVGGARTGHRSGRSAQEELHQDVPAPDAGDHDLRRRRLSRLAEEGDGDRRLQGLRQAQARVRAPRQAARHRLSRPISRPAASRRRRRSARSAPASACGNPPRCGSIRPARSKC